MLSRISKSARKLDPRGWVVLRVYCSKEESSQPQNLCGHGHGRVQTSDGKCAMVTRRGSGFLFPSVLEGGEVGELALTLAQRATNLHATRRS